MAAKNRYVDAEQLHPPWNSVARRQLSSAAPSQDLSSDNTWLYIFMATFFVSFLATLVASIHLWKLGGNVFRSSVRFVTTSFLVCMSLHALAGALYYVDLIATMDSWFDDVERARKQSGSSSSDGDATVDVPRTLILLLGVENIFFVLGSYWFFLLACELYQLANRTHDRGEKKERRQICKYASGAIAIFALLLGSEIVCFVLQDNSSSYQFLDMFVLITIIVSLLFSSVAITGSMLFSWGALVLLKIRGRKNEHIHGTLSASPLYRRLKRILIVSILFTLPYSGLQFSLVVMPQSASIAVPDYVINLVTVLYYLFGAAQAFVMAGSQHCCVRLLNPMIPEHLRNTPEWLALQDKRRAQSTTLDEEILAAPEVPVFVNTDIESSSALWAQAPQHVIDEAQRVHDDLVRSLLPKFRGYEITTAGDAFQLAFHSIPEAVEYCLEVQLQLVHAKWPSELHGLVESTKTERDHTIKMTPLFRGLRVRMGIHDTNVKEEGLVISQVHPVTGKTLYIGASELIGREIGDLGYGGQIIVSKRIAAFLRNHEDEVHTPFIVDYFGTHDFSALALDMELYHITPKLVEGRRRIFKKRRATENKNKKKAAGIPATPTASSNESTGDDSSVEFRAQRSPTEEQRQLWSRV